MLLTAYLEMFHGSILLNCYLRGCNRKVNPQANKSAQSNLCKTTTLKKNQNIHIIKNIAECSKGSIMQYFRPSLSYLLSLRSLFCLFLVVVLHRFC